MSAESDRYEREVAEFITEQGGGTYTATRPNVNTKYSDVLINDSVWLEVKMNHSDNLGNPRLYYSDSEGGWGTTYTTPAARFCVDLLNNSAVAKKWVDALKAWLFEAAEDTSLEISSLAQELLDRQNCTKLSELHVTLPTTKAGLKKPDAVCLELMRYYCDHVAPDSRYVARYQADITELVTDHYQYGKAEPASYLLAGDDLYRIGDRNPFGWPVPILTVTKGTCHIRISTRSQYYEIMPEIKAKQFEPSGYSLKPGTTKRLPF